MKEVIPCEDALEWGRWFDQTGKRRVDYTEFGDEHNTNVSTVFVGIDMSYPVTDKVTGEIIERDPMVFESMVFSDNPDLDGYQWRYSSWDKAQEGHDYIVQEIYKQQLSNGVRKKLKINFNLLKPNEKE